MMTNVYDDNTDKTITYKMLALLQWASYKGLLIWVVCKESSLIVLESLADMLWN